MCYPDPNRNRNPDLTPTSPHSLASPPYPPTENLEGAIQFPVAPPSPALTSRIVYSPRAYGPDVRHYLDSGPR